MFVRVVHSPHDPDTDWQYWTTYPETEQLFFRAAVFNRIHVLLMLARGFFVPGIEGAPIAAGG